MQPLSLQAPYRAPLEAHILWAAKHGASREEAIQHWEELGNCIRYENEVYVVLLRPAPADMSNDPDMFWLSLRRRDGQPVTQWTDKLWIKDQVLGPEGEAVEMLPARSRLVDGVNQYHLLGYKAPKRFPFGFNPPEQHPTEEPTCPTGGSGTR